MSTGSKVKSRLGCSTITFRDLPLSDALDRIHRSGLTRVDIACIPGFCPHIDPLKFSNEDEEALTNRLSSLGLRVSTLNVSAGGLNGEKAGFVHTFYEAAIVLAARLGCYAVTIPSGSAVAANLWKSNAEASAGRIKSLADTAGEHGVLLTIEAPHPGTLAETVAQSARFFELLQEGRVKCTFDTSHVARGNAEPVAACIGKVGAAVGHLHLRDCIGENNHLTPGKGEVDFAAVMSTLDAKGYRGDVILELEGKESAKAYEELEYAISFIAGLK